MINPEEHLSPEDMDIEYARQLRRKLINKLTADETSFPQEAKDAAVLAGLISDIDRMAIARKRVKMDEQSSKQNGEAAALIAQFLGKISGADLAMNRVAQESVEIPTLPEGLEPPIIIEGMTDTHPGNETYREFSKRMQALDDANS